MAILNKNKSLHIDQDQVLKIRGIECHKRFKLKSKSEFEALLFENNDEKLELTVNYTFKALINSGGSNSQGYIRPEKREHCISIKPNEKILFLIFKALLQCEYISSLKDEFEENKIEVIKTEGKKYNAYFKANNEEVSIPYYVLINSKGYFILVDNTINSSVMTEIEVIQCQNLDLKKDKGVNNSNVISPKSLKVVEFNLIDNQKSCILDYNLNISCL